MEEEWDITVTVQSLCNRRQVIDFDFFPYGEAPDLSELESGKDEESELSGDDEKKEDGEESDKDETQGKTSR